MYNKFQASVEERGFDATNFVGYLQEQLTTKGLYFAIQTVEDGSMSEVFWTLTDSLERWIENSDANIVLFDTTHGTNKYTLKFAAFCTVNKHGNTQVLACTLLDRETEEAFTWAFCEFLKAFRHPPKIFITDGDPAMAAAIRNIYPSTIYLLCTFHIGQNIVKHIKPLFSGRHENLRKIWNAFLKSWWNICKKQVTESLDNFDKEWKELLALVQSRQNSNNEKVFYSAQLFLRVLYDKGKQWASRCTRQHLTLGAHSTQRSESIHSTIKQFLNAHTLLTHLAKKVDENRKTLSEQNEGRATRLALKMATYSSKHPIERDLKLTPFALAIVKAQIAQCIQYSVDAIFDHGAEKCMKYTFLPETQVMKIW